MCISLYFVVVVDFKLLWATGTFVITFSNGQSIAGHDLLARLNGLQKQRGDFANKALFIESETLLRP